MIFPPILNSYYPMKGWIFVIFLNKRINNADLFSQPSLIIFTKGADIFGHDCMYIYIKYRFIFHLYTFYYILI